MDAGPTGSDTDPGVPAACIEKQAAYVRDLLPRGEDLSVGEAVLAVLAHPEIQREMPYCSGERP